MGGSYWFSHLRDLTKTHVLTYQSCGNQRLGPRLSTATGTQQLTPLGFTGHGAGPGAGTPKLTPNPTPNLRLYCDAAEAERWFWPLPRRGPAAPAASSCCRRRRSRARSIMCHGHVTEPGPGSAAGAKPPATAAASGVTPGGFARGRTARGSSRRAVSPRSADLLQRVFIHPEASPWELLPRAPALPLSRPEAQQPQQQPPLHHSSCLQATPGPRYLSGEK